jgi:signal transduction histidine kinase
VPSPPLRIALIEPDPAYAAELGQLLSDTLRNLSVQMSDPPAADLVLMNEASTNLHSPHAPTILFGRSADGSYSAHSLCGDGVPSGQTIAFAMPLADSIRCAVLMRSTHTDATPPEPAHGADPSGRLQQRLLQLQKMEAVGELAGGIAHDFNNLLLVIRSYAEMLLEEIALPAHATHYAQEILAASRRASDLTRELLAFSRKQPLQMKPTSLNGVIDSAVPMLSRLVGKGIVVWVQSPPNLWPILADVAQLEQVLVNLSANARDAMPRGGKLLLETSNVAIEDKHAAMPRGEYVMLAVSDTGMGIPHHILPRIFEPFFTTKERGKGTGLGLASVYGIVKQSGGYIWAYSESGYGTTFKIYMPRAAAVSATTGDYEMPLAVRAASNAGS